jgi:hypothetical protein
MNIHIASDVADELDPRVTARLRSGRVSLPVVDCYACGNEAYPATEETALSLLLAGQQPLTLFSHTRCAASRVLKPDDLAPETIPPGLAYVLALQGRETAWNHLQAEIVRDDAQIRPAIGDGGLTRSQARANIQAILDASTSRLAAQPAALWRTSSTEDIVYAGQFLWCVYEYPADQDPRGGALGWLHTNMSVLRHLGFGGDLPKTPADWLV